MDTWVWGFYHTAGVACRRRCPRAKFRSTMRRWTNINGSSLHKLIDLGDDMPVPLQNLIVQALNDVYLPKTASEREGHDSVPQGGAHQPRVPDDGRGARAHDLRRTAFLPRPKPPSVLNEMRPRRSRRPAAAVAADPGGNSGGSFSLAALLPAILDFIRTCSSTSTTCALAALAGHFPADLSAPLRAVPATTGTLRDLPAVSVGLCSERLCVSGSRSALQPARATVHQPAGPSSRPCHDASSRRTGYCLFFPAGCTPPQTPGCVEPNAATSGPYTRWPLNYPYWFIEGEPTDLGNEKARAGRGQKPGARRRNLRGNLFRRGGRTPHYTGSLGSAIDFFLRHAEKITAGGGGETQMVLRDWNLDGDRGYGFQCWQLTKTQAPVLRAIRHLSHHHLSRTAA